MKVALLIITPLLLVGVVIANGVEFNIKDILNDANLVVNQANLHRFALVLEIYYDDNLTYPNVENSQNLAQLLYDHGYIQNKPVSPGVFEYIIEKNGQDYSLTIQK